MARKENFWPLQVSVKYGKSELIYNATNLYPNYAVYLNDTSGKMPRYYYLNRQQVEKYRKAE